MKPTVSIIAAISLNNVIGRVNKLPWYIPDDLKRFKEITYGHALIMGRKTWQSLGKPLPGRTNIIVTKNPNYKVNHGFIASSLEDAINIAKKIEKEEIFVIGGGEIFRQAINISDKLYLTQIKTEFAGDVFFPDYADFTHVVSEEHKNYQGIKYTFLVLTR